MKSLFTALLLLATAAFALPQFVLADDSNLEICINAFETAIDNWADDALPVIEEECSSYFYSGGEKAYWVSANAEGRYGLTPSPGCTNQWLYRVVGDLYTGPGYAACYVATIWDCGTASSTYVDLTRHEAKVFERYLLGEGCEYATDAMK